VAHLCQGVECRLEDVALVEVGSVGVRVFTIHDVFRIIDFQAESPKYVVTQIEQEPKAHAQNCRNQTLRFGKPDGPISSILMTVKGTIGTRRWSFSFDQATSGRRIDKNHGNPMG
jgi:hypothetical protein